jgi:putative oxidoreductase
MRFLNRLQPIALLLLRLGCGSLFFAHGWAKLANSSGTIKIFTGMGFPGWLGILAGAIEIAGGLFLVLGLFTRLIGLIFFIEMCIAIVTVHWKHAPWWDVRSYEPPLALGVIALALAAFGAGAASVDHALFRDRA